MFLKRIDGPTPNGGTYAEVYYYDEHDKETDDVKKAVKAYGREYDKNGKLINEVFFTKNNNDVEEKEKIKWEKNIYQ